MASETNTYMATETDLTSVANKIRAKVNDLADTDKISFPSAFVSNIEKLSDTRDANATAGQILSGRTAYVNKSKITGTIPSKAAATIYPNATDQSISAGQYLSGAQTIKGVTNNGNATAANIKKGVTVQVGVSGTPGKFVNVTGTFTSDANAPANKIINGYSAYVNGQKIDGTCSPTTGYGNAELVKLPSSSVTIAPNQWAKLGEISYGPRNKLEIFVSDLMPSNVLIAYRYDAGSKWVVYALNNSPTASKTFPKNSLGIVVSPIIAVY